MSSTSPFRSPTSYWANGAKLNDTAVRVVMDMCSDHVRQNGSCVDALLCSCGVLVCFRTVSVGKESQLCVCSFSESENRPELYNYMIHMQSSGYLYRLAFIRRGVGVGEFNPFTAMITLQKTTSKIAKL